MNQRVWRSMSLLALLGVLLLSALATPGPSAAQDDGVYWPTDGWRTSTPEEQGVESARLNTMLTTIQSHERAIDSVFVVRHGHVVLDATIHPNRPQDLHIMHSCTKSVMSTLIGIAIEQGFIDDVDVPLLDLLPAWEPDHLDADKQAITLEDVLMMTSGLDCRDSYLYNWRGLGEMIVADDWVQHMLDLPMAHPPGAHFEYCNGGTYLLSRVLEEATGQSTQAFAQDHLFRPLGITAYEWVVYPNGNLAAWGGLMLTAPEMAKIGYLMLHDGQWDGQQIVSPEWVTAATATQIDAETLSPGYGYQWWVDETAGFYAAKGHAGQFIYVVPKQDLIVVFTSSLNNNDFTVPESLVRYHILPGLSADVLPPDPEAVAALNATVKSLLHPTPLPVEPLPEMALEVSGQLYDLEDNEFGFNTLTLTFEEGAAEAWATFTFPIADAAWLLPIGLDGVYRYDAPEEAHTAAAVGAWTHDDTFEIRVRAMENPTDITIRLQFTDEGLTATVREHVDGAFARIYGVLRE